MSRVRGDGEMTRAGCVVTFLSFALILGVAFPIVHFLDSVRPPPPKMIIIVATIFVGALFQAAVSFLLGLVGIRMWKKKSEDDPLHAEESDDPPIYHD